MSETGSPSREGPDEIGKAIESLHHWAFMQGAVPPGTTSGDRAEEVAYEKRTALTTAILARLAAVEAERDQALREYTDMMWQRRRADERADAALARAERAEKALDFYRSAAVTSATMEGLHYQGVSSSMFRHAWEADRAALSPVAEEA